MQQRTVMECGEGDAQMWVLAGDWEAHQAGLTGGAASDCSAAFVAQCLERMVSGETMPLFHSAWLRRCAHRFALDWRRAEKRRSLREEPWPRKVDDGDWDEGEPADFSDTRPDTAPIHPLLRRECERALSAAVADLDDVPRTFFLRRVLNNETYCLLAAEAGKSEDAVRKIVVRAANRVRTHLERHGWTEADLREGLRGTIPPVCQVFAFFPFGFSFFAWLRGCTGSGGTRRRKIIKITCPVWRLAFVI